MSAPAPGTRHALGISAKSIHAPEPASAKTAVSSAASKCLPEADRAAKVAARRHRFDLMRVAQGLLWQDDTPADRQHRTVWCHRTSTSSEGGASVMRAIDGSSSRFGGITTCGNVWACPVCCAKVAEVRRHELSHAMARHIASGGWAYLLTFTSPHDRTMPLAELREAMSVCRQRFQNSRAWKAWIESASRVGAVTSQEVTYGHNGWHPHLHMLAFAKQKAFDEGKPADNGDLSSDVILELQSEWVRQLERVGLVDRSQISDAMRYALNVRGGSKAAEYVAKYQRDSVWGSSSELTRQHAKVARRRLGNAWHATPFQLLAMLEDEPELAAAWSEYVEAMSGKRMLTWSPGLRAHFGIGKELTPEQLAAEGVAPRVGEEYVGRLDHFQFRAIVAAHKQGAFLEFIATYGAESDAQRQIDAWVAVECARPVDHGAVRRRMTGSRRFTVLEPPPEPADWRTYPLPAAA